MVSPSSNDLRVSLNMENLVFGTQSTSNTLVITNAEAFPVTYKLKTSTPQRYAVKPRMGYIDANSTEQVQVQFRTSEKEAELATIRDKFQVEVRPLSDNELQARGAAKKQDKEAVQQLLGTPDPDTDVLTWIWKNCPPDLHPKRFQLDCRLTDLTGGASHPAQEGSAAYATPRRATEPASEMHTAQATTTAPTGNDGRLAAQVHEVASENLRLRGVLKGLEKQKTELYSKNKAHLAAAEELRSKSEPSAWTIPAWLFLILWLGCFYLGLVMDRWLPGEYHVESAA